MKIQLGTIDKNLIIKAIKILLIAMAIFVLVFMFLFLNKGKNLLASNTQLINTICKTSAALDKDSGTNFSTGITPEGFKKSRDLQQQLNMYTKQVSLIIKQRDDLSAVLKDITDYAPIGTEIAKDQFSKLNSYAQNKADVIEAVKKLKQIELLYANTLIEIADKVDSPFKDKDSFKTGHNDIEDYKKSLNSLIEDISGLKNSFDNVNKKLTEDQSKTTKLTQDIASYKLSNDELVQAIENYKREVANLEEKNTQLTAQLQQMDENNGETSSTKSTTKKKSLIDYSSYYYKLSGKVLAYNQKWGVAILDLGKSNPVQIETADGNNTASIAVPLNKEMYVARDGKFVAKVEIEEVHDNYSVANLVFPSTATINPGDIVFFPYQEQGQKQNTDSQ